LHILNFEKGSRMRRREILKGLVAASLTPALPAPVVRHLTRQPIGPKRADDVVADLELLDALSDGDHFPGAVRHWNAPIGARNLPLHYHVVMEVQ
jgi:hypothetical protein